MQTVHWSRYVTDLGWKTQTHGPDQGISYMNELREDWQRLWQLCRGAAMQVNHAFVETVFSIPVGGI